jgi:uncharacterized protein (DUF1778 family)
MVKVKNTEPLAQLNIKIAPALRRAIEKAALAEERSISNFAQKVLGAYVRKAGFLPPPPAS